MVANLTVSNSTMSASDETNQSNIAAVSNSFCRDFIRGFCDRENCKYIHEPLPKACRRDFFRFCHDNQNKGCFRSVCKFVHGTVNDQEYFLNNGIMPKKESNICQAFILGSCNNQNCTYIHPLELRQNERIHMQTPPPMLFNRPPPMPPMQRPPLPHPEHIINDESPPKAKLRRFAYDDSAIENQVLAPMCRHCVPLDHKIKLLHENISVLLKRIADLTEKNAQLTSMNEFLLQQTSSLRADQPCVVTSRHGASAPVSLATVSVTPVVSLAGALPALVPAGATSNLTLAPAASRAQLLTPAPQLLTVSTTQQLVGNSGALIVTSAGAQQLMQVSDSGTLMGAGQTVVAVTPAQLTLAPPGQQLMTNASQTAVQQLVPQSMPQLAAQHQSQQYAAQQSVQHLAAQQNAQHLVQQSAAQHLAVQQSAQHLAAQQCAQHLAVAQESAQHLAAAHQSAQHLAAAAQQSAQQLAAAAQQSAQQIVAQQSAQQQLVHQSTAQQITISSSSQPIALANSQAQSITFPIISQSILPH